MGSVDYSTSGCLISTLQDLMDHLGLHYCRLCWPPLYWMGPVDYSTSGCFISTLQDPMDHWGCITAAFASRPFTGWDRWITAPLDVSLVLCRTLWTIWSSIWGCITAAVASRPFFWMGSVVYSTSGCFISTLLDVMDHLGLPDCCLC